MPQLDTVYIFTTYLWTWLMLHLMMRKIKTHLITTKPTAHNTPNKMPPALPWL